MLLAACATGGARPAPEAAPLLDGLRALYDGRSVTRDKTQRFRLAVALTPERMRLEVLPPIGGPRLVVTADGARLLALDPANRRAEIWESEAKGVERLIGAGLGASELRTLLEGRSPCDAAEEKAAGDRGCAFGGGTYRSGPSAGGGETRTATLFDASGRPLLSLEYPPPPPREGAFWPAIVLQRPGGASTIRLTLASGPTGGRLDPALFSTERPERFAPGVVLGQEGLEAAVGEGAREGP